MNVSFNILYLVSIKGPILTNACSHTLPIIAIHGFPALQWGPSIPNKVMGRTDPT